MDLLMVAALSKTKAKKQARIYTSHSVTQDWICLVAIAIYSHKHILNADFFQLVAYANI